MRGAFPSSGVTLGSDGSRAGPDVTSLQTLTQQHQHRIRINHSKQSERTSIKCESIS